MSLKTQLNCRDMCILWPGTIIEIKFKKDIIMALQLWKFVECVPDLTNTDADAYIIRPFTRAPFY